MDRATGSDWTRRLPLVQAVRDAFRVEAKHHRETRHAGDETRSDHASCAWLHCGKAWRSGGRAGSSPSGTRRAPTARASLAQGFGAGGLDQSAGFTCNATPEDVVLPARIDPDYRPHPVVMGHDRHPNCCRGEGGGKQVLAFPPRSVLVDLNQGFSNPCRRRSVLCRPSLSIRSMPVTKGGWCIIRRTGRAAAEASA
jgi:hypothetical protein